VETNWIKTSLKSRRGAMRPLLLSYFEARTEACYEASRYQMGLFCRTVAEPIIQHIVVDN